MIKKLIPFLAILVAAIIIIYSGAFTSVEAERMAVIDVAGDASALLALAPASGPNGAYAGYEGSGALYLDIGAGLNNGLNVNARTVISDVFTITNNGTQLVYVTVYKDNPLGSRVDFADAGTYGDMDLYDSVTNHTYTFPLRLYPGQSSTISLIIDTTGLGKDDVLMEYITFYARRNHNE
ncbi:MAG: DUF1102 domain-containing protein [Candidatus Methanofastidiosa archaeon]|nr:DUF1102 domain-containing protein [Candidatus Methanofastidiosa archaeon]